MEAKRRDRVAKACALCRRKKIKCDGATQCANCVQLNAECVYLSNKVRKPRAKLTDSVAHRMATLEKLVMRIAEKVDTLQNPGQAGPFRLLLNGEDDDDEDDDDDDTSLELLKMLDSSLGQADHESFFQQCKTILLEPLGPQRVTQNTRQYAQLLHYKGHHLGIAMVFSQRSIDYVKLKLRPDDQHITNPLETLPYYITAWRRVFQRIWLNPQPHLPDDIRRLGHGVFPEREVCQEALDIFAMVQIGMRLCDHHEVEELFKTYFANKKHPPGKRKKLTYSELMLMNLVVVIALSVAADRDRTNIPNNVTFPRLEAMSMLRLVQLQEELFHNIAYYYQRVCMASEGLTTVEAILLLVIYLETSWVMPDVNYILTGMAVRYAQELGLHRPEIYAHLPIEEQTKRARIWAACADIDTDICYRLGKPPLVNIFDSATSNPLLLDGFDEEPIQQLLLRCPGVLPVERVYRRLSTMRSITYIRLFSAHVNYQSVRQVQQVVLELNAQTFGIGQELGDALRPRFHDEVGFDKSLAIFASGLAYGQRNEILLALHLTYFHHIMTVNRVPWHVYSGENDSPPNENSPYRKLSIDSARTILHIIRAIDCRSSAFLCLNWLMTYPFAATMNLLSNCLNHAEDSDVFKDLSLVIDVSMNFFAYFGSKADQESTRLFYMRFQLVDLVVRVLLRVVIKVVEERSGMNILDSNPAFLDHLGAVEKNYPQIYTKLHNHDEITQFITMVCDVQYPNLKRHHRESAMPGLTSSGSPMGSSHSTCSNVNTASTPQREPAIANIISNLTVPELKDTEEWALFGNELADVTALEHMNLPNFFFDNGL